MATHINRRRKNVKIFTRVLPSIDFCHDDIKIDPSCKLLSVRCLQDFLKGVPAAPPSFWSFPTDGVFYNISQEEVYEAVTSDVIDSLLKGQNVVIVSYGQTGSGKSFTLSGLRNKFEHRGIAPRLLSELFERRSQHEEEMLVRYKMSYVEVVGREMRDLLAFATRPGVREHSLATAVGVSSEEEGLKLMFQGEGRVCTCEGAPYPGANMGHTVLTIHVENTSLLMSHAHKISAKIHIVDLAGIDTTGKETSLFKMPRDIGRANNTKSVLQQVLSHLAKTEDQRQSPVIGYMGKTLSNDSILRLVGHIRPTEKNLDITLSTMRLGEKVSGMLCTKVKLSRARNRDLLLQTKAVEVEWLRGRVELAAMLDSQPDWRRDNLPEYRMKQLHEMAHGFISDRVNEIRVRSVVESSILMQDFKEVYTQKKQTVEELKMKLAALAEEAELAKEKALLESKEMSASGKLAKRSSSNTASLGSIRRGKKTSSKALEVSKDPVVDESVKPPTPLLQVGQLRNDGITIGPGIVSDYQGEVTKASKRDLIGKHRQRSDIPDKKISSCLLIQEQLRCAKEFSSDGEAESKPLPASPEQAWLESPEVLEIRVAVDRARTDLEVAFNKYVQASSEMKELHATLALMTHDLLNEQHLRHVTGREEYDGDGKIVVTDNESRLARTSKQREAEIVSKREVQLRGLNELNECVVRLNEAKKRLNEEYYARDVKVSPTVTELTSRQDSLEQQRSKHYQSLRHMHFSTDECKVPALG